MSMCRGVELNISYEWEDIVNENHRRAERRCSGRKNFRNNSENAAERKMQLILTAAFAIIILVAGLIILEVRGIIPEYVSVPVSVLSLPALGFLTGWWFSLAFQFEKNG